MQRPFCYASFLSSIHYVALAVKNVWVREKKVVTRRFDAKSCPNIVSLPNNLSVGVAIFC
jgi:hypothetical protein